MKWRKPKTFINNILALLGFIGLLIMLFAIATYYTWFKNAELIRKIDKKIPSNYINEINNLKILAHKTKVESEKYKYYSKIEENLHGITILHQFYNLKNEAHTYIINKLSKKNGPEALQNAKTWVENYPYDFTAKFKYLEILKKHNMELYTSYLEKVAHQFKDINPIVYQYVALLLENGDFNKAIDTMVDEKKHLFPKPHKLFMFYFLDKNNAKFSKDAKVRVKNINQTDGIYTLKLFKGFKQFNGLRFDFDNLSLGSKISDVSFTIKSRLGILNNVPFTSNKYLDKKNNTFNVIGKDPFFILDIPNSIKGVGGNIEITVKFKLDKKTIRSYDLITQNPNWKIAFSSSPNFAGSKKFDVIFDEDSFNIKSTIKAPDFKFQYIKLDFPTFPNFIFNEFKMLLDGNVISLENNGYNLENLDQIYQNTYLVTRPKNSIVLKTITPKTSSQIYLEMNLGDKK